jgi:Kef-type K+ transport system membrane component KefB
VEIVSIEEHQMLVFWVQLFVLLAVARLFGAAMKRVGQPAVVGELAAGLVLGPTVFGKLWPGGAAWLFPPDEAQSAMLLVVGWIGIVMLLVVTGFETDLKLIRQLGRATVFVAGSSVIIPFALGLAVGFALPLSFVAEADQRSVFALFIAAALSISSLPVIAKILSELRMTRRNFGQVILAAGMANDVVGWLILGAIAGIAKEGEFAPDRLIFALVGMALFLGLAFTVGQQAVDGLLRRVRAKRSGVEGGLAAALVVAVGAGAVTQALGVEAVLGAFVAGIVLSRSRFQDGRVLHHLEAATSAFFAPLFFATAGLRVDLALLARLDVIFWAIVVILVATAGKFLGAFIGGKLAALANRESLALGIGLNARGALEIVIATVGLSLGILNDRAYTVVVLMAIVTSMAAPPMLRLLARNWRGSPEEQLRLEREETLSANVLVRPGRVLVPISEGDGWQTAARLLEAALPDDAGADVDVEAVEGDDPVEALLDHVALGYGIVGMGARDGRRGDELLAPLTEAFAARSPVPVLLVWDTADRKGRSTGFDRVLVPVVGTQPNRAAQEFAFSLAAHTEAEALAVHVVSDGAASQEVAFSILAEASDLAGRLGADVTTVVKEAGDRTQAIVDAAREYSADLVVLSAELQPAAGQLHLGALVEDVLSRLDVTVAVVALPPGWGVAPAA